MRTKSALTPACWQAEVRGCNLIGIQALYVHVEGFFFCVKKKIQKYFKNKTEVWIQSRIFVSGFITAAIAAFVSAYLGLKPLNVKNMFPNTKFRRFYGIEAAKSFIDASKTIREKYLEENLTAREVAAIYLIDFAHKPTERAFTKALSERFPKAQWGGRRAGSGNKKGWRCE